MTKTPVFSGKLDALSETVDLFAGFDVSPLAAALATGARRHTLAIGSGGSAIAADYFARCRDTLSLGPTSVQTPMQAVMEMQSLAGSDVWLFSASGDNPDVLAAARAVADRHCETLHLVTRNRAGAAIEITMQAGGSVHLVPVADPKDGYLATHSLLSSVIAFLLASDVVSRDEKGASGLLETLSSQVFSLRDMRAKREAAELLSGLRASDTIILLADPLLQPLAKLLDTSIWEASLCPVQATDFRNFAHGRHTWLRHRSENVFIIALTTPDSQPIWSAIDTVLPPSLRRIAIDLASGGRLDGVLSIIKGLGLIEALGSVFDIDPGKPGIGEYGRPIYESRSLETFADRMPSRVRHKRSAMAKSDETLAGDDALHLVSLSRFRELSEARIGGAVFDYDGTIVTTEGRFADPDAAIVDELVRLHSAGLSIGIATGRGGSAGEHLRRVLPVEMTHNILVGYYNGGHLRSADIDIDNDLATPNAAIHEVSVWLRNHPELFVVEAFKDGPVQITVEMKNLRHPYRFAVDVAACASVADGNVRIVGSAHSYDIVPTTSTKISVVDALKATVKPGTQILCFGDSGAKGGNDHFFLSHPFGISVGEVCSAPDGCWSLFGASPTGPAAVLRVLRALVPSGVGEMRLDAVALASNIGQKST